MKINDRESRIATWARVHTIWEEEEAGVQAHVQIRKNDGQPLPSPLPPPFSNLVNTAQIFMIFQLIDVLRTKLAGLAQRRIKSSLYSD